MPRHEPLDLLQGTLDLLILRTLQAGRLHGWAISERIEQISQNALAVNQGSLYPALHRLEHRHWIQAEWGISDLGKRARIRMPLLRMPGWASPGRVIGAVGNTILRLGSDRGPVGH